MVDRIYWLSAAGLRSESLIIGELRMDFRRAAWRLKLQSAIFGREYPSARTQPFLDRKEVLPSREWVIEVHRSSLVVRTLQRRHCDRPLSVRPQLTGSRRPFVAQNERFSTVLSSAVG